MQLKCHLTLLLSLDSIAILNEKYRFSWQFPLKIERSQCGNKHISSSTFSCFFRLSKMRLNYYAALTLRFGPLNEYKNKNKMLLFHE